VKPDSVSDLCVDVLSGDSAWLLEIELGFVCTRTGTATVMEKHDLGKREERL
jgi:hypothetical protein